MCWWGNPKERKWGFSLAKHRTLVGNSKGRYWDLSTENLEASIKEIRLNSEGSAETLSAGGAGLEHPERTIGQWKAREHGF